MFFEQNFIVKRLEIKRVQSGQLELRKRKEEVWRYKRQGQSPIDLPCTFSASFKVTF